MILAAGRKAVFSFFILGLKMSIKHLLDPMPGSGYNE